MRGDAFVDASSACQPCNDPRGLMSVHPLPIVHCKDRSFLAFTHRQVHRACGSWSERCDDLYATFTEHFECVMATLESKVPDVTSKGFGHSQPVASEQAPNA